MRCETDIFMEFVCLDQRFNRRLVFPRQKVVVTAEDGQKIDLKKTMEINEALQYTLSDCVLFTSSDDAEVMLGVLEKDSELKMALTAEIKDSQKINLSFLRMKSPVDDDSQCLVGLESFQQSGIAPLTLTRKRKSEETPGIAEESNSNQIKKRKKLSSRNSSGNIPTESDQQQQQQLAQQPQPQLQQPSPGSEEDEMSAEKDEFEGEKAISKKSQERMIKDALEMVCRWRDLQDFYKTNSITKDYQSVADEIGISKKTLDYYYLELRTAEYFGFDFDSNLKNKMGYLREFVTESKKIHRAKFSTNKIPRNSSLKYRIPRNYQESQTGKPSQGNIEHTAGITPHTHPFYDPAMSQHQQQQPQPFMIQQFQQPPQGQQQQMFQQSMQPQHQILQRNGQSSQASAQQAYPEQSFQTHLQQQQQQHFSPHAQIPQHLQQPPQHRQQQQLQQVTSSSSQTLQMMMEPHSGFSPTLPLNQQGQEQAQTAMPAHFRPPFSHEFYSKTAFPSNEQQSQYSTAVITQRFSSFYPYSEPSNIPTNNNNNIGNAEQISSQQLQSLQLNRVPSQKQQPSLNNHENNNNRPQFN